MQFKVLVTDSKNPINLDIGDSIIRFEPLELSEVEALSAIAFRNGHTVITIPLCEEDT